MEIVADFGNLCGECPIWDPAAATLYWTDCVGQMFFRYTSGVAEAIKSEFEVNGYRLNAGGGFAIANNSGAWLWDGADGLQIVAAQIEGAKCQFNDCTSDPAGRLIAGTCFYDPNGTYPLGKLMRIDTDGQGAILDEGFQLSNGLAFAPDGKLLYFADSVARTIFRYDYDVVSGNVRNRQLFVQVPLTEGLPDGLAVDDAGFVWSAQWYGGCIVRYDPDGKEERRIAVPAKQTSALAFGGPDLTDIYITSAANSEPMPVMPPGYDPTAGPLGGPLFRFNAGIAGRAEWPTRIALPDRA